MQTTELKDLYKWAEDGKPVEEIYGVTINDFDPDHINPPEGLKFIGVVASLNETKTGFNTDLVDLIVSYGLEGVHVLLEMPCDLVKYFDVKELIFSVKNLQVSLSVLPPKHPYVQDEVSIEEYKDLMGKITQELLNQPNYSMKIYPISNYIVYMMLGVILKDKLGEFFSVKEDYVIENYIDYMTEEDSDLFKDEIRKVIYNHYGGEEGFDSVASVLVESIYDLSKDRFKESVNQYMEDVKLKRKEKFDKLTPRGKAFFLREEKKVMLKRKKDYKRKIKEISLNQKRGFVEKE